MKIKFGYVGFMSLVALLCQSSAYANLQPAQVMLVDQGEAISYVGEMEEPAIIQVENLIKNTHGKVKRLVIDSGGGDVNLGMDLAGLVLENSLDVVVENVCGSSCANYVFPAGKTKHINPNAVVVWHGSAIQEGLENPPGLENLEFSAGKKPSIAVQRRLLEEAIEGHAKYIADIKLRQASFYARLGVDERVTVIGQQLKAAQEWTLTPEDMAYFGIGNVTAPADYGHKLPPQMKERGVKLLQLKDYPDYAPPL